MEFSHDDDDDGDGDGDNDDDGDGGGDNEDDGDGDDDDECLCKDVKSPVWGGGLGKKREKRLRSSLQRMAPTKYLLNIQEKYFKVQGSSGPLLLGGSPSGV